LFAAAVIAVALCVAGGLLSCDRSNAEQAGNSVQNADLIIYGGLGNDVITGGSGNDTIYGGDGTNNVNDGADNIQGGAGNDSIDGGAGVDTLNGYITGQSETPTGSDTISYATRTGGFAIDFSLPQQTSSEDGNIFNFENITGSLGSDSITGNNGANMLDGWQNGADSINGNDGDDAITVYGANTNATNTTVIGGLGQLMPIGCARTGCFPLRYDVLEHRTVCRTRSHQSSG
jgi:Ca2+-binding RTX toxin-like protein